MNEVSLKPVIDELETLFSKFNKAFFEGKLEKPVITVSPDHTRGAYGWCTGWKAWQDGTKEGGYANSYEQNYQAQYDYYKAGNSRVAYNHSAVSTAVWWWLRSPYYYNNTSFQYVTADGTDYFNTASYCAGVRPGFAA